MVPSRGRRSLLVLLLSVLLLGPAPGFRPAAVAAAPAAPVPAAVGGRSPGPGASAEVERLYEQAARATEAYERGRRAADTQRALARRLQGELARQRAEVARLRDRIGEIARAQYRGGGTLALTARLLLAGDPDELMRSQRITRQAGRVVNRLLDNARRAEGRLDRAERRARAAWRDLERRGVRLAVLRKDIEARLRRAQARLQAEASRSAAAGRCPGSTGVRPAPPARAAGPAWVAPVTGYVLSAGFASAGAHWAHRHTGQDFAVGIGTPVRSVGAGRVESVSCGGAFGIQVLVRHGGGWYSQYAHLAAAGVVRGQRVAAGQRIGQSGNTGNSTGPHLHFEVRLTPYLGSGVDPARWLREHGVPLG
ncbi:M23 family metallopeptidase [Streptomyces sp. LP05-1]|uniref:M23 family metallopeptidase n=1 Tax=Streptomyces pyxinae TaxID=2970734 RepID=A0ABT2CCL8_9ACTN|nr:M23 family metallopeptidase [Streptomyces sp. LP05-1]MCS0635154.1 M23 family metallopeptidase [Streptomyces sp. LP05-1]